MKGRYFASTGGEDDIYLCLNEKGRGIMFWVWGGNVRPCMSRDRKCQAVCSKEGKGKGEKGKGLR